MISVLVADDSDVMRKAIVQLLCGDPEINLLAEATGYRQATELAGQFSPEVVVLDIYMQDQRQVAPAQVKSALFGARVIAISLAANAQAQQAADELGATKLLDKMTLFNDPIPAIKQRAARG